MQKKTVLKSLMATVVVFSLASCGGSLGNFRVGGSGNGEPNAAPDTKDLGKEWTGTEGRTTIWDAFRKRDTGTTVNVNRYLWNASLEVLNFLPVQSIDPFTGVIVTGYGTPPGGGRAYRATIYIKDPALDARSLNVAMATRGGPVAAGTQRAVENAILARARELRIKDKKF